MSVEKSIRFNGEEKIRHLGIRSETPKVDLNDLIRRVKEEKKKTKRNNLAISAAALSAAVIFGIILTL